VPFREEGGGGKTQEIKMTVVSMKALLESGVHFGHRTHKWHPAMKPYIFTERNGIHIIDLQKTAKALEQAYNLIRDNVGEGGTLLFVGTKRQAQDTIRDEAMRCGMPYVTNRWLGGMLTNWRTIRQRVIELDRLERMRERGDFARLTKKEALILERKMERLEVLFGGIRKMPNLPDMMFVIDVHREATAVHEANLLNIPLVALVDTNCDPTPIDHVIPSNDDAIRAIKLLVGKVADAVLEGKAQRKEEEIEALPAEGLMAIAEEPELSDEELLGEATLAKLPTRGKPLLEDIEEEILIGEEAELEEVEEEVEELDEIELEEIELEEIEVEIEDEIEEEVEEEVEEEE
jgi:small subunit ribosomal protein S2